LREMGSFPLLTREGEVEVAKRIESGQQEVLSAVLNCPIAIREVINLGKGLRTGKIKISEITNEIDDEMMNAKEERIQKKKPVIYQDNEQALKAINGLKLCCSRSTILVGYK
jgi:RNA polymerase primary sigma factor